MLNLWFNLAFTISEISSYSCLHNQLDFSLPSPTSSSSKTLLPEFLTHAMKHDHITPILASLHSQNPERPRSKLDFLFPYVPSYSLRFSKCSSLFQGLYYYTKTVERPARGDQGHKLGLVL